MALALLSALAALSLTINPPNLQSAEPAPRQDPVRTKRSARTRLRSFKQATKAKLRRGHDKDMASRPRRSEVIEISDDDDEDELPYQHPPAHAFAPRPSQVILTDDGDDEDELDSSPESDFSDAPLPQRTNPRVLFHDEEVRQRNASSETTSAASSHIPEALRRQRNPRVLRNETSSLSADEDPSHPETYPRVAQLHQINPTIQPANKSIPSHPKIQRETDQCPYYHDHKLEVKMYRGRGYETFPVVLGTVEGHKEICDNWDTREASKIVNQHTHSSDTGLHPPTRSIAELELEDACLQAVLQIFPEIEHDFVRNLYRQGYTGALAEDVVGTVSAALIADIAESETYPKQKSLKRKHSPAARDETGVTIGWNKDLRNNRDYCRETIILLATIFDHIPTHYISKIVKEKQSLFDAFGVLSETENNFYNPAALEKPYKRLRHPRRALEGKYQRKHFEQREGHLYVNLVNELQAARQSEAREACKIKHQKASDDLESENLALHIAQGSMVECQCCFDEKPINRAVPCEGEEAHFFCNDCVRRQAESQIGAMKYEMRCMDTSGCKAELSIEAVAQAVPLQLYDKLTFNQQQAEISSAGIEGLETCPFCDFKAICEPVEVDSVFDCQNPDCGLVTCRKCKERSHLPKTCEEVKKDKGLGARHKVEEARSEAMMRTCPKCKVRLIKEYGCNKMICTNCRAIMCYICQKDISGTGKEQGYDHFHRAGATCALHDTTGVDRHETEADAAERVAIAKAKAEYEDIDEKALQVETGKNKKRPLVTQTPVMAPPHPQLQGMPVMVPPHPQLQGMPVPVYYGNFIAPPFPAMPPFPAVAQFNPNFHVVPHQDQDQNQDQDQGQGQLLGQLQQGLDQMQQLIGPPAPILPNVAGQAPPLDPRIRPPQTIQAFLQQRRQNRA